MASAIKFDDQPCFCTIEIRNIIINGFLPLKTYGIFRRKSNHSFRSQGVIFVLSVLARGIFDLLYLFISLPPSKPAVLPPPSSEGGFGALKSRTAYVFYTNHYTTTSGKRQSSACFLRRYARQFLSKVCKMCIDGGASS